MATIANWNGHVFEVSPNKILGFTDLSLKSGCETEEKVRLKRAYIERTKGNMAEISMTVHLNAQTGISDVMGEALAFVREAIEGASAYFYLEGQSIVDGEMMLTGADVSKVEMMPGRGSAWISCDVKLTFKQSTIDEVSNASSTSQAATQNAGKLFVSETSHSESGGSAGSGKTIPQATNDVIAAAAAGAWTGAANALNEVLGINSAIGKAKNNANNNAKKQSSGIFGLFGATSAAATTTTNAQSKKTNPTTGRSNLR